MAIPCDFVRGKTLPEAWEKAVLKVYYDGLDIKTEYDDEKDPPSKDMTLAVEVTNPQSNPMIHKNIPCGPAKLQEYVMEVIDGIHDHWIDPDSGKWTYTYHQRLWEHDQIDYIVRKLSSAPYSRRAQAVTWKQCYDPKTDDPPCLQSVWCRMPLVSIDDDYYIWELDMRTHWRSRDLWNAWFMNAFAFITLQEEIARLIERRMNDIRSGVHTVKCGSYGDVSNSLHIYGSAMDDRFYNEIDKMDSMPYKYSGKEERTMDIEDFAPLMAEAKEKLEEDPDYYAKGNH